MAGQDRAGQSAAERGEGQRRLAFDKSQNVPRSGSVGLVLLVALLLAGAGAGLAFIGHEHAASYILILLAALGTIGVFALFAMASGILRFAGRDTGHPLLKSVVDNAADGVLVTDHSGRIFYANASYLDLT